MHLIPLPALGVEVPVCVGCFGGTGKGAYLTTDDGYLCNGCYATQTTYSPDPHPWPQHLTDAVINRVAPNEQPSTLDVTYYNLCLYPEAAHQHPEQLARITAWLQTTASPDIPEPRGLHLGTIGQRSEFELRMEPTEPIFLGPSDYGDRYLFKFRDAGNNLVVWFTGENCWVKDGWSGKLKASVKDHAVYAGERQTIIQRAKEVTV